MDDLNLKLRAMSKKSVQSFLKEIYQLKSNFVDLKSNILMDGKLDNALLENSSLMNILNESYETILVVYDLLSTHLKIFDDLIEDNLVFDEFYKDVCFKVLDILPNFDAIKRLISRMIAANEGEEDLEILNEYSAFLKTR